MSYKSNRHVLYACKYQGVFCPKFRRTVLVGGVDKRLKEIIDPVAKELGGEILELEVMPDPVHILGEVDPHWLASSRVSTIEKQASFLVDTFLFCLDGWRCSHRGPEAIHPKPKECLNENVPISPATLQEPTHQAYGNIGALPLGLQ